MTEIMNSILDLNETSKALARGKGFADALTRARRTETTLLAFAASLVAVRIVVESDTQVSELLPDNEQPPYSADERMCIAKGTGAAGNIFLGAKNE